MISKDSIITAILSIGAVTVIGLTLWFMYEYIMFAYFIFTDDVVQIYEDLILSLLVLQIASIIYLFLVKLIPGRDE